MNITPKILQNTLKILIKRKKISYEQVAQHLGVSLATIKRMLNHNEITLFRLMEICDFLEINISQLYELAKKLHEGSDSFTEEQEQFLADNRNFYAYYLLLFTMTPEEIETTYHLSKRSTNKYLLELEKRQLIIIKSNGTFKPFYRWNSKTKINGPLSKKYGRQILENFHQKVEEALEKHFVSMEFPKYKPKIMALCSELKITEKNLELWKDSVIQLLEKIEKLSEIDEGLYNSDELQTACLTISVMQFQAGEQIYSPVRLHGLVPENI